jgi:hypothetical protein
MSASTRLACWVLGMLLGAAQARAEAPAAGYSAAGLYNLANSYARAGKPGLAILNYERASLLAPGDPDVEVNLKFVRTAAHLPVEPRGLFERLARVGTPLVLSWIGLLGIGLIGAGAINAQFSSGHRRLRLIGLVAGILMVGAPICSGVVLWPKLHAGVIIAASTPARVSPVPMGDALFVLREGETVKISAEHEGFTLIQTSAGRTGWVADSNLAAIVPLR